MWAREDPVTGRFHGALYAGETDSLADRVNDGHERFPCVQMQRWYAHHGSAEQLGTGSPPCRGKGHPGHVRPTLQPPVANGRWWRTSAFATPPSSIRQPSPPSPTRDTLDAREAGPRARRGVERGGRGATADSDRGAAHRGAAPRALRGRARELARPDGHLGAGADVGARAAMPGETEPPLYEIRLRRRDRAELRSWNEREREVTLAFLRDYASRTPTADCSDSRQAQAAQCAVRGPLPTAREPTPQAHLSRG